MGNAVHCTTTHPGNTMKSLLAPLRTLFLLTILATATWALCACSEKEVSTDAPIYKRIPALTNMTLAGTVEGQVEPELYVPFLLDMSFFSQDSSGVGTVELTEGHLHPVENTKVSGTSHYHIETVDLTKLVIDNTGSGVVYQLFFPHITNEQAESGSHTVTVTGTATDADGREYKLTGMLKLIPTP